VKPSWAAKIDSKQYPIRFLASIWQQRMKAKFPLAERSFTSKEFGQMKVLKLRVGDLTQPLIEWIVDPLNWWYFCQEVRAGWKTLFVPDYPHIGFLLGRRGVALRVMRSRLSNSADGAEFVKKLEEKEYLEIKDLLLAAYAAGNPKLAAKIDGAKTLAEMQQTFLDVISASQNNSSS
jgi:hypothetical protein